MDTILDDTKIMKVTPGQISSYVKEGTSAYSLRTKISTTQRDDSFTVRFKMFLHELKLSKKCVEYIKKHLKGDIYITLKWEMLTIDDFITSPEKLEQSKTKFDFTIKYTFRVDQDFITSIVVNPMIFKIYADSGNKPIFLGQAHFYFDSILDIANIKQRDKIIFKNKAIDVKIAHLDVWYKFTCKQKVIRTFYPAAGQGLGKIDKLATKSQTFSNIHVTDSEFDLFADSVWLVLNRNKVLKTTQSDINTELQERVRWLRFEANWKQTLQENAILHGKDPENIIWRQWREEDTANVRLRTYDNISPKNYKPELSIIIKNLFLVDGCSLLKNDDVQQFFVEYSFLGYEGPEMETPYSLPKRGPFEKIVFNFKKTFSIDISKDLDNCKKLTELIKEDGIIKFVVVSEPLENKERPIQTCKPIGFVEVPLSELIQLQENVDTFEYEIIDVNNAIAVLGFLTIKVEGILAMRKMALDLMAPKGYKLYM